MSTQREAELGAKKDLKRGAWTREEDERLSKCIKFHGETRWRSVPAKAGLNRCARSCRLRWLNYLRPNIKRGNISEEEEDLIIRLHKLLGNRWSLIAGRLPGRTDNEIKNYWKSHLSKKVRLQQTQHKEAAAKCKFALEKENETPAQNYGGSTEFGTEPPACGTGVSSNILNIEQILSGEDNAIDCCFWNSNTERGSTESGNTKQEVPSDADGVHRFDSRYLNDYDLCMGNNVDSDTYFQRFIHSLFCDESG